MGLLFYGCLFFLLALVSYYLVKKQFQVYVLFFSSIIFIASLSINVAIFSMLFTVLNYFLGLLMEKYRGKPELKLKVFWFSIFLDVAILAFFKYFNFFIDDLSLSLFSSGVYSKVPFHSLMIPLGISYYTFQTLGYLIRVSRGNEKAEHNFAAFATYLLFFPKFLSGPVSRSNHLLPQINQPVKFERNNIEAGAQLFLWGLFKKVVIADNLYGPVTQVYSNVHDYSGTALIIVLLVQIIYIYFDFSGYTDMALGLAKMFGINLIDNFNRPLLAKSISEFWRRWHISLSSWCNDFIYNPFIIKYRRFGNRAVIAGIFVTFFIVGIWHGANLTFVILGLLQGAAIVYEFYTKKYRLKYAARFSKSTVNAVSRIIVFLFMTMSMVFFFSNSVSEAWYFLTHLFSGFRFNLKEFDFINQQPQFAFALCVFIVLFIFEMLNEKGKNLQASFLKQPLWVRWAGYFSCMLLVYVFYSGVETFYYMRF
ncbi:MAG: MBOAT family O-acyltransferase [Ginsengibacter sp.]